MTKIIKGESAFANPDANAAARALLAAFPEETEGAIPADHPNRAAVLAQNTAGVALQVLLANVEHGDAHETFATRMGALTIAAAAQLGQTAASEADLLHGVSILSGHILKAALATLRLGDRVDADDLAGVQCAGAA